MFDTAERKQQDVVSQPSNRILYYVVLISRCQQRVW